MLTNTNFNIDPVLNIPPPLKKLVIVGQKRRLEQGFLK